MAAEVDRNNRLGRRATVELATRALGSARAVRSRVSAALFRRPWLRAGLLLSAPGAWFVLIYLAALFLLFLSALWSVDSFSGKIVHSWTLENFETLVKVAGVPDDRAAHDRDRGGGHDHRHRAGGAVRLLRRARSPRGACAAVLFVAVLIPLWSSYLARVFAWRLILAKDGVLNYFLERIGLGSVNVGYSNWAMWIVFSYIWLPFMILPVWAAIERVPDSLIEASADLGAHAAGARSARCCCR